MLDGRCSVGRGSFEPHSTRSRHPSTSLQVVEGSHALTLGLSRRRGRGGRRGRLAGRRRRRRRGGRPGIGLVGLSGRRSAAAERLPLRRLWGVARGRLLGLRVCSTAYRVACHVPPRVGDLGHRPPYLDDHASRRGIASCAARRARPDAFDEREILHTMSEEPAIPDLAMRVRPFVDAVNRRDFDTVMGFYGSDAVWDMSSIGLGTFRGLTAIRGFWEEWIGDYDEYEIRLEDIPRPGQRRHLVRLCPGGPSGCQ